jgi:hypothetical protein
LVEALRVNSKFEEAVVGESQTPFVECVLRVVDEKVEFVIDGVVRLSMPEDAYKNLESQLSDNAALDPFPVEYEGATVGVRLPPFFEIRKNPATLYTEDGVAYERLYRIGTIEGDEAERTVQLVDAKTDEVVGAVPWQELIKRVRFGTLRSGTTYERLLGEYDEELYREVTGKPFRVTEDEAEADAEAEAEEAAPVEEEKPTKDEKLAAPSGVGLREWLNAHPLVAVAALIVAIGFISMGLSRGMADNPPVLGPEVKIAVPQPSELSMKVVELTQIAEEFKEISELTEIQKLRLADLLTQYAALAKKHPKDAKVISLGKLVSKLKGK